MRPRAR
jgi:hypothetical protein